MPYKPQIWPYLIVLLMLVIGLLLIKACSPETVPACYQPAAGSVAGKTATLNADPSTPWAVDRARFHYENTYNCDSEWQKHTPSGAWITACFPYELSGQRAEVALHDYAWSLDDSTVYEFWVTREICRDACVGNDEAWQILACKGTYAGDWDCTAESL